MVLGGQYGKQGFRFGPQGAQYAGTEAPPGPPQPARGIGYDSPVGGRYSPGARGYGGTYGFGPESIGDIIERSDGFVLVIEREDGERWVASTDEMPAHEIISLSLTYEVNNLSDWRVKIPPDPALFDFSFAKAVIGFDGERLFHGQLLPASGDSGGAVEVGGFGPLWYATHGHIEISYSGLPMWQAINDCWETVADVTDGRVRGYALRPSPERERWFSEEGREFSGTPLAVLKELHGIAGMAFTFDHTDPAGVGVSFIPGEARRVRDWRSTGYTVELDPTGYHNRVICVGADAPATYPYDRYRGQATAARDVIRAVTNGEIIEYWLDAPDAKTPAACEQRAEAKLMKLRDEFSITGSVETALTRVTPGFTYRIPEFDNAAPAPFEPVAQPLRSAEHSFANGEASTSLQFETPEGVVGMIRDMISPDAASDDVATSPYPDGGGIRVWGESVWGAGSWGGEG